MTYSICASSLYLGQPLPEAAPMAGPEVSLTLGAYKVQGVLLR